MGGTTMATGGTQRRRSVHDSGGRHGDAARQRQGAAGHITHDNFDGRHDDDKGQQGNRRHDDDDERAG